MDNVFRVDMMFRTYLCHKFVDFGSNSIFFHVQSDYFYVNSGRNLNCVRSYVYIWYEWWIKSFRDDTGLANFVRIPHVTSQLMYSLNFEEFFEKILNHLQSDLYITNRRRPIVMRSFLWNAKGQNLWNDHTVVISKIAS